ncbi:unnamed protein product [Cyprideis torosa]|uniref:Uncharacterized protein n=1 Tax=Cyprideis torosa TaxID=163714 RepID=A0A7R8WFH5_9CRUS|nr:unnamed protein product [Cyprideis torosa]CAG0896983.1 unnamed protein product [Cyprideis torosa]
MQQTQAAVAQNHLLKEQLSAESSARMEAQSRTHHLLRSNQQLLEHIRSLVLQLVDMEAKLEGSGQGGSTSNKGEDDTSNTIRQVKQLLTSLPQMPILVDPQTPATPTASLFPPPVAPAAEDILRAQSQVLVNPAAYSSGLTSSASSALQFQAALLLQRLALSSPPPYIPPSPAPYSLPPMPSYPTPSTVGGGATFLLGSTGTTPTSSATSPSLSSDETLAAGSRLGIPPSSTSPSPQRSPVPDPQRVTFPKSGDRLGQSPHSAPVAIRPVMRSSSEKTHQSKRAESIQRDAWGRHTTS